MADEPTGALAARGESPPGPGGADAGPPPRPEAGGTDGWNCVRRTAARLCAVALPLFCLAEVNHPLLTPQSELALFALFGVGLAYLGLPGLRRPAAAAADLAAAAAFAAVCLWLVVQTEPAFSALWSGGQALGERAGAETATDLVLGLAGLMLLLVATRRTLGWALPLLALAFLAYAYWGSLLPDALLPHRGYGVGRIVAQTFLHSQGVFGVALKVMFTYVFLFLAFGALLEATGATGFILETSRRLFRGSRGGPAKVAVLSSGLMGSLSGSAVANTATTGTFTIPMMRSAGFAPHVAAGLEAAASSGGALVPPVMGAGAYMMLEIIDPPVGYLDILRAALIPACLYYLSLFLIVHLHAGRLAHAGGAAATGGADGADGGTEPPATGSGAGRGLLRWEGAVFVAALASLVALLVAGFSVFRAVSLAMAAVVALAALHRRTRLGPRRILAALTEASRGGTALVCAAAAVGIVIGVVTLTGVGSRLPAILLPLAQDHLLVALAAIMVSSIVLGMGLPSAVCYLLLATLIGPVLGRLGVVPLAAHMFIFYFGMMSMVTPPVALAAYAASSIAGSPLFASSLAAFRFALVGFTLPYLFVFRPELLMLTAGGGPAAAVHVASATLLAIAGIVPLAAAIAGYLGRPLGPGTRGLLLLSAALALFPGRGPLLASENVSLANLAGIALFLGVAAVARRRRA